MHRYLSTCRTFLRAFSRRRFPCSCRLLEMSRILLDIGYKIDSLYLYIFFLTMELPEDVIAIIRDFSRPITRPDWRILHRLTSLQLHLDIARQVDWQCPTVLMRFVSSQPGDYIFNFSFLDRPCVLHIYKRNVWLPIRV